MWRWLDVLRAAFVAREARRESMREPLWSAVALACVFFEHVHVSLCNLERLLDRFGDLRRSLAVDAHARDHELERRESFRARLLQIADFVIDPGAIEAGFHELRENFGAVLRFEKDWREDDD